MLSHDLPLSPFCWGYMWCTYPRALRTQIRLGAHMGLCATRAHRDDMVLFGADRPGSGCNRIRPWGELHFLGTQGCVSALLLGVWSPGLTQREKGRETGGSMRERGGGTTVSWTQPRHSLCDSERCSCLGGGSAQSRERQQSLVRRSSPPGETAANHGGLSCVFLQKGHHLGGCLASR